MRPERDTARANCNPSVRTLLLGPVGATERLAHADAEEHRRQRSQSFSALKFTNQDFVGGGTDVPLYRRSVSRHIAARARKPGRGLRVTTLSRGLRMKIGWGLRMKIRVEVYGSRFLTRMPRNIAASARKPFQRSDLRVRLLSVESALRFADEETFQR